MMTITSSRPWLSQNAHAALRDELAALLRHQTTRTDESDVTAVERDDHDSIPTAVTGAPRAGNQPGRDRASACSSEGEGVITGCE